MGNEIQKNLSQRAKELLQTDEEHSLFELAELLQKYRNETHPDNFQDQELKTKAEARFKDAQSLLEELEKQLEIDRFNRKPSELAVYKPLHDVVQLQSDLYKTKRDLEDTKEILKTERENVEDLRIQLQTKQDDSLRSEIEHLQSLYKPSTRKYASIGLAIVLSGAFSVMTQMEKVTGVLEKYSPFEKYYVSTGLFIWLIFFLVMLFRKLWESEYIQSKSEGVCSPKYAADFLEHLKKKRSSEEEITEFSEVEVFDFITGGKHVFKKLVSWLGFRIYSPETINRLKDIFIHNLLNKKLIHVSRAEMMQRHFIVLSSKSELYWYHEYTKEKEKNLKASTASTTN